MSTVDDIAKIMKDLTEEHVRHQAGCDADVSVAFVVAAGKFKYRGERCRFFSSYNYKSSEFNCEIIELGEKEEE